MLAIDEDVKTVELRRFGRDVSLSSIPWDFLTFLDDLDESQNSLRIVREATED